MKLYEFGPTRSYKVRWLIKELNTPVEIITVNLREGEHLKESFLKINPFGKIPALVDGDLALHEASAICNYLCDKNPEKNLIPKVGTKERAIFDKWNFFASNEIECHLWTCEKHTWRYPEKKRSADAIEMASEDIKEAMKIVESHLAKNEFMMGDYFSCLDVNYAYLIRWARGRKLMDGFPKSLAYLGRMMERPNYPSEIFQQ